MLPNIGFGELVVILGIALLLFGAKKLPEIAQGMGQSVKAFKKGLRETMSEIKETSDGGIDSRSEENLINPNSR